MMTMLAERHRLARHAIIAMAAPGTVISAKVRRQSGQRDA
jgi:hypothetical protein